jgi:hypothetical protein
LTDPGFKPISQDAILAILASGRTQKADSTLQRDIATWFKLNQVFREEGCDNPDCADPRPADDKGREIVTKVQGQFMCRHCYLAGWLLQ